MTDEEAGMLDAIAREPLERSGDPLHEQLRRRVSEAIAADALAPGTPLPTEQELQDAFGVSRSVVRQALASLAAAGSIERRRGRGSVVAARRTLHRSAERAGGLLQHVAAQGGSLRTRVLSLAPRTVAGDVAAELGVADAWALSRVRSIDDDPVVVGETLFSRARFPQPSVDALTDASLLDWMRQQGADPVGGPRRLRAAPADADVAALLGVAIGAPLLLLEGVTEDATGVVLERFSLWHAPDTVFDVDARVRAGSRDEALADIRAQLSALQGAVARLDA